MFHEPSSQSGPDPASKYKTRLGVWMFCLYALVYAGFVAINIFQPLLMEKTILFGLNLAVAYGFGLIIFALLLALIYNHLCSAKEAALEDPETEEEGK